MTGRPAPDEVITRGQVTLRRYREDDLDPLLRAVTESLDHLAAGDDLVGFRPSGHAGPPLFLFL